MKSIRRHFLYTFMPLIFFVFLFSTKVNAQTPEVLVYGATPAGIAAALAAGDEFDVLLVEPTQRIGGMVTNGLSHTDFHTFEGITGTFYEFTQRIADYYRETYGEDSPQSKQCFRGTHGEPKVNLKIFTEMLAEKPRIQIQRSWTLSELTLNDDRIKQATFKDASGRKHTVSAQIFIDATYEGDLMAMAGVPYRVGREGHSQYGESLAPEKPDDQVQGYNFRLTMTKNPENRITPKAPEGYDREMYLGLLPLFEDGRIKAVFGYQPPVFIYKAQIPALPNDKVDINDVSRCPVRLSMPSINNAWPDGDAATREKIYHQHVLWNIGMLYFLQNDEAVPKKFQEEARQWGWCKDEFVENEHLPIQLYIREARRMVGQYIFTQGDTEYASGDARGILQVNAIAMGEYSLNCHGTGHEGPRCGGRHTGEFYQATPPYQIPYGVIVSQTMENLLVPVAISASHVGFCALRLEPIWISMGDAAGQAARLALQEQCAVQDVPVNTVQSRLHEQGTATIYVSDVPPGDPDFAMAQWWGTVGGFHGLYPQPEKPGQRGKHIIGQYYEAFPGHAAELDKVLDEETRARWEGIARELGIEVGEVEGEITRGGWLRGVWGKG